MWNRLGKRLRAGDDVFLPAGASLQKRPPTTLARFEVKQQVAGQRVGIPLDIGPYAGGLEERVAVVIKVLELRRDVFGERVAEDDAGGETVANSRLGGSHGRINAAVAVQTVPHIGTDFVLLGAGGRGYEKDGGEVPHFLIEVPHFLIQDIRSVGAGAVAVLRIPNLCSRIAA